MTYSHAEHHTMRPFGHRGDHVFKTSLIVSVGIEKGICRAISETTAERTNLETERGPAKSHSGNYKAPVEVPEQTI